MHILHILYILIYGAYVRVFADQYLDSLKPDGKSFKNVKLVGKGFLQLVDHYFWYLPFASVKQGHAVRQKTVVTEDEWDQRWQQIVAEHEVEGARESGARICQRCGCHGDRARLGRKRPWTWGFHNDYQRVCVGRAGMGGVGCEGFVCGGLQRGPWGDGEGGRPAPWPAGRASGPGLLGERVARTCASINTHLYAPEIPSICRKITK